MSVFGGRKQTEVEGIKTNTLTFSAHAQKVEEGKSEGVSLLSTPCFRP